MTSFIDASDAVLIKGCWNEIQNRCETYEHRYLSSIIIFVLHLIIARQNQIFYGPIKQRLELYIFFRNVINCCYNIWNYSFYLLIISTILKSMILRIVEMLNKVPFIANLIQFYASLDYCLANVKKTIASEIGGIICFYFINSMNLFWMNSTLVN